MHRRPPDLSDIRPSAELDAPMRAGRRPRPSGRRRRPPSAPRPRPRRRSILSRLGFGLAVTAAVVGVGASAFFYIVSPTELVREQLIQQVKAKTGRTLSINGPSRFMLYPSIGVSLGDVTLSEPPGMSGKEMVKAERIDVSVALMPLFAQEVHVEHVALVAPDINLRVDREGRESWSFAGASKPARYAALGGAAGAGATIADGDGGLVVTAAAPAQVSGLPDYIKQIELRSIALTKARIRYHDERTGTLHAVEDLNIRVSGRRLSDPVRAIGDLVWQGETVSFDARLDAPEELLGTQEARTRVALTGAPFTAGFEGTVKLRPGFEARGAVRFDGRSVAAAAEWFGTRMANATPLGGFRANGRLVANADSVALNEAQLVVGEMRASGIILAELKKVRPYVSADLKISDLDIDKLSAALSEAEPAPSAAKAAPLAQAGTSEAAPPQSIEDLLQRSETSARTPGAGRFAPQVRGYERRDGWSREPIDAAALGAVDAKARLQIDGLRVGGLGIERTVVRLALAERNLKVTIDDVRLYGGAGKGIVTAGPTAAGVTIGGNIGIEKVAIQPLLKDAADFEMLAGRGDVQIAISGTGKSQHAIAQSLTGNATLSFKDGAIVGWNLAKILRGLGQGEISNLAAVKTETTDFSELAGTFKITNGNAVSDDLMMHSPLLRVSGAGRVGIGPRDLDLGLKPKLVSSLAGQGGQRDIGGLEVPVRLKGPWRAPRVVPDLGGLAKDPNQLIEKARDLGRQLKGRNFSDIVRGALGNGGGQAGDGQAGEPADGGANGNTESGGGGGAQDLIKRFLR